MRRYRKPVPGDVVRLQESARGLWVELRQMPHSLLYCNPRVVVGPDDRLLVLEEYNDMSVIRVMTPSGASGWMSSDVLEIVIGVTA